MPDPSPAILLVTACSLGLAACGGPPPAPRAAVGVAEAGTATTPPSAAVITTSAASALAEAARALVGTWDCRGSVFGPEGPSPSRVSLETRPALDGAWLHTEFAVTSGKYPYEFSAYRTFQASSGAWVSLIADNLGGHTVSRSADGVTWTGTSSSPMGELQIKDSENVLAPGKLALLGQYSLDGGATWSTGYELACTK